MCIRDSLIIAVVGCTGGVDAKLAVGTVYTAAALPVPVADLLIKLSAKEKSPSCCFFF